MPRKLFINSRKKPFLLNVRKRNH